MAKSENISKSKDLSEKGERWIEEHFHFIFCRSLGLFDPLSCCDELYAHTRM